MRPHRALPLLSPVIKLKLAQFTEVRGDNDCWPWTGEIQHVSNCSRGKLSIKGRPFIASRLTYYLHYGIDPGPSVVRHSCDNGVCQNPKHLLLGGQVDNIHDRMTRFRGAKRMTPQTVIQVLRDYANGHLSISDLAVKNQTCQATISEILRGVIWNHVTGINMPFKRGTDPKTRAKELRAYLQAAPILNQEIA